MNIYISGPMTGIADDNKPAFNRAAAKLRAMGHNCENPAEQPSGLSYGERLALDLAWICAQADALVILRGAVFSKGVAVELALANALALPVYHQLPDGQFLGRKDFHLRGRSPIVSRWPRTIVLDDCQLPQ